RPGQRREFELPMQRRIAGWLDLFVHRSLHTRAARPISSTAFSVRRFRAEATGKPKSAQMALRAADVRSDRSQALSTECGQTFYRSEKATSSSKLHFRPLASDSGIRRILTRRQPYAGVGEARSL